MIFGRILLDDNDSAGGGQKPDDNNLQARIDQLVKRSSDAEGRASDLAAQNSALSKQILSLTEKVDAISKSNQSAGMSPIEELLSQSNLTGKPKKEAPDAHDLATALQAVVKQELAPVVEAVSTIQTNHRLTELQTQQQNAFLQAKAALPELGDSQSPAMQTFLQIWENRPDLQEIGDSPLLIAEMVRGLMSVTRQQDKVTAENKAVANVIKPTGGRISLGNSDQTKAKDLLAAHVAQGTTRGWADENQAIEDLIQLKMAAEVEKGQ